MIVHLNTVALSEQLHCLIKAKQAQLKYAPEDAMH